MLLGIGAARVAVRLRPNRHKKALIRIFAPALNSFDASLKAWCDHKTKTHKTEITWMKLVLALVQ